MQKYSSAKTSWFGKATYIEESMADLRHIHQYMTDRRRVLLDDGRVGKIVRVDTTYPSGGTLVSIWTEEDKGPTVAKVELARVVGPAPAKSA